MAEAIISWCYAAPHAQDKTDGGGIFQSLLSAGPLTDIGPLSDLFKLRSGLYDSDENSDPGRGELEANERNLKEVNKQVVVDVHAQYLAFHMYAT